MSLINARGSEVEASLNRGNVDLKTVFIRLKENESLTVRVLGPVDYVEYDAHGSFAQKIYTQACIKGLGEGCPLCDASKSGVEEFTGLYAKKRYLFAFGDMVTGKIRVLDVTKGQAKKLLSQIKEYKDDLSDVAFNLKRTGTGTETSISLNPILRLKGEQQTQFDNLAETVVEDSFFESVLIPRTKEQMLEALATANFPMAEHFPNYSPKVEEEYIENTDMNESDMPF